MPCGHLTPEPFMIIHVDADRADLEYLVEPLDGIHRKRYGLTLDALPTQKFSELCAVGETTTTVPTLESIINNRGS
jgi:hypothetical protein